MSVAWGAALSLASAATFGFNAVSLRRGILTGSVTQALAVTIPIGIPLFLVAAWVTGELVEVGQFTLSTTLILSAAGILHFGFGRYANYRAVRAMGSNLSGAVGEISIVVSLLLAMLLLGESLSVGQIAGIVLIFAAAFAVREQSEPDQPEAAAARAEPAFRPNIREGYAYSLLSAAAYGSSPILVRAALSQTDLPSAAGLISSIAATIAFGAWALAAGAAPHISTVPRAAVPWFLLSGFFVGLSQVFRYVALSLAPVVVVAPIQRLSLIFRALFGLALNREYETWNRRVLVALVVAVLGGLAVALG